MRLPRCVSVILLGLEAALAESTQKWSIQDFKTLVTFGDSYTDDTRISYFINHNGSAPPVGWVEPITNQSASGGYIWGHFVHQYAHLSHRYNYAVSGASCSNKITPRTTSFGLYPSVLEYEVPAFTADNAYHIPSTGEKFLQNDPDSTIYSIWIGTNDLGNYAFLTDSQVANKTIPDYVDCVFNALDGVYKAAKGKYFVIMNMVPLQLAPLYATPENGGIGANNYWPDKSGNFTEISYRMWEQVSTVNQVYDYRTPFEWVVGKRYPGAKVAVMDMYSLISDIYYHPQQYLNGSAPANVTGYIHHCNVAGSECETLSNPDSFLWYDQLHPSQRTDEIIAEEFIKVVKGESEYATYWS
ncbi:GDSL lipase/acylhydrolase family protein [Aspergillus piperis CBS 112811]|uniref:GDSL lipase/acylhydrolase family protein n=1 Tax=Aspergillus piperis CBS 112811 TaxID=1448313 RepID=A0A8G1VLR7_9EURO|nr:GDSL lipase/acylhydrolase family protein [Aspergillus piperis CBS 112811]RAH56722.1 GDSL lipase/acylhydrolase family protein [Aspergillus piperis CBS 112811]